APGSERWWDGAQWTASTRAASGTEVPLRRGCRRRCAATCR
ncbi:DUF2510 domain-containing protein, partial [Embleya sp. NPDC056538]